MADDHRVQGAHFTMTTTRLRHLTRRTGLPRWEIINIALDHPWPAGHQQWLDTAGLDELHSWLWTCSDTLALTQELGVTGGA
jgi:hypothetical protein